MKYFVSSVCIFFHFLVLSNTIDPLLSTSFNPKHDFSTTTKANPYVWKNVKIVAGGFVDGILFHPGAKDVLYIRTDMGGAYRFDPSSKVWIPLNDNLSPSDYNYMGIESLAVDPTVPGRVYAAVGMYTQSWAGNGAILRSDDYGKNWTTSVLKIKLGGNEDGRYAGERLVVDPNQTGILFFGSRNNGLWRSSDYGVTWNQVTSFPITGPTNGVGVVFVMFDTTGTGTGMGTGTNRPGLPTQRIYVGTSQNQGLYLSTDGGTTWKPVPGQPTYLPNRAVLTNDSLFVTYGNVPGPNGMTAGALWRYSQNTWTNVSPAQGSFGYAGLTVDAQNPGVLMVATMDRWATGDTIFRSLNSGLQWEDIGPNSVRDISVSPWITFGAQKAPLGWWIGALEIDPFRPGRVLYGTGATVWTTDTVTDADKGLPTQWRIGAEGIEQTAVLDLISPPVGAPLYSGVGDIGGFRHDNLDISPPAGMYENPKFSNTDSLDFAELSPEIIVRVGSGGDNGIPGGISVNSGTTWRPFATAPTGDATGSTIAASADGRTFVWTRGNSAAPYFSLNQGATWTQCMGAPPGLRVVSDRVNPSKFYGYDSTSGTVYVSTSGAVNFTKSSTQVGSPGQIRVPFGEEGHVWVVVGNSWDGSAGVFRSTDSGVTFTKLSTVGYVRALGFGRKAPGGTYPAVYIQGTVGGLNAMFRSDDMGVTWVRINDDENQFGGADVVAGDPRVYGRVYIGTNGRGVLYGEMT